uniref:SH2 domain-containing protein n=1 Tax=Schistocephalus solidus TaxID=70667 RepID=A0A183SKV9_SCHSO
LVRDSVTHPGCWALSVRVPEHVNCMGITHYLIQHSKHGVKLKGLDKEWPSLEALITHLTVMPEMLPCPLRLPSTSAAAGTPNFLRHQEDQQQSSIRLSGANRTTVPSSSPCPRSASGRQTVANGRGVASSKYRSVVAPADDFSLPTATSFSSCFSDLDTNMHSLRLVASGSNTSALVKGMDATLLLSEDDIGEEYQRLSDFSSMLADMRVQTSSLLALFPSPYPNAKSYGTCGLFLSPSDLSHYFVLRAQTPHCPPHYYRLFIRLSLQTPSTCPPDCLTAVWVLGNTSYSSVRLSARAHMGVHLFPVSVVRQYHKRCYRYRRPVTASPDASLAVLFLLPLRSHVKGGWK